MEIELYRMSVGVDMESLLWPPRGRLSNSLGFTPYHTATSTGHIVQLKEIYHSCISMEAVLTHSLTWQAF